jgi:hypothetical protein
MLLSGGPFHLRSVRGQPPFTASIAGRGLSDSHPSGVRGSTARQPHEYTESHDPVPPHPACATSHCGTSERRQSNLTRTSRIPGSCRLRKPHRWWKRPSSLSAPHECVSGDEPRGLRLGHTPSVRRSSGTADLSLRSRWHRSSHDPTTDQISIPHHRGRDGTRSRNHSDRSDASRADTRRRHTPHSRRRW